MYWTDEDPSRRGKAAIWLDGKEERRESRRVEISEGGVEE